MNLVEMHHAHIKQLSYAIDQVKWEDKQVYGNWLAQTYYYICHSTRLLALAGSYFQQNEQKLHERFLTHAGEEMNHELIALADLKKLGFTLSDFPELPSTRSFYQTSYYAIERITPWAFYGYILALEGLAVAKASELFERVGNVHGKNTGTFLKVHAADDQEHVKQALEMLEQVPKDHLKAVLEHFETSVFNYCAILKQVKEKQSGMSQAA